MSEEERKGQASGTCQEKSVINDQGADRLILTPPEHANLRWIEQAEALTATDLALIAANIGSGLDEPEKLAAQARDLWQACAEAIDEWPVLNLRRICASLPRPRQFPVTFDDFLELLMPDLTPPQRLADFRRFLADYYAEDNGGPSIEERLEGWRGVISEKGYYLYMRRAFVFTEWRKVDLATSRSIATELQFAGPQQREETRAYLEEQAAATRREGCLEASRTWDDTGLETAPRQTFVRVTARPGAARRQPGAQPGNR